MAWVALVAGLALLWLGGDWLVDGGSGLARRLGVRPYVVGLTVVAIGTTAPELAVGVRAALAGGADLALANVVGASVANLTLVLGAGLLLRPLVLDRRTIPREAAILAGATVGLGVLARDGLLGRLDAAVLLAALALVVGLSGASWAVDEAPGEERPPLGPLALGARLVGGMAALPVGADLTVSGARGAAGALGVSEWAAGAFLVALGTSLPELAVAVVAASRDRSELMVGNVVGSNALQTLLVPGVAALVRPLEPTAPLGTELGILVTLTAGVGALAWRGGVLGGRAGTILLACYTLYVLRHLT